MAETEGQLAGRVAVVTGASRGVGAAIAKRYAAEGAHLVLVARGNKDLEAIDDAVREAGGAAIAKRYAAEGAHLVLVARGNKDLEAIDDAVREAGGTATLVPLDLMDGAGIDRLGGAIAERYGRLDILVGNAGLLGPITPLSHVKPEMWERVMAVNVNANWHLIRSFDALLRAADAGRAIFVTSGVTRGARAYWGAYATSKAALEMLVATYAEETAKTSVRVNLVNPGAVRTGMRAKAMPGEDPMTLPPPEAVTDVFVELALPACRRHGAIVSAQ